MLLSTTTGVLNSKLGDDGAIKLLADAGFDAYDMSFISMYNDVEKPIDENYMEYIKYLRGVADEANIVCNQAHAPFASSFGDSRDEKRFKQIVASMRSAAYLGAKNIIVHPKQHLKYSENADKLKEMNIEFYKSLIPYCEEYGIRVAAENMWQYDGRIVDSTCSKPDEFCDYIDSVGSEWIVACLDIGHVVLTDTDMTEMIKKLGHRLCALHVHDNDFINDSHTLPYLMKIDFDEVTAALADINYSGDFTFEAEAFFSKMPKELLPAAARLMHDTGRYLMRKCINK